MKKNIVSICLLFCFSATAFAVQCPSASDFIHVKGQPWQLSLQAQAQGWRLGEETANTTNSDDTAMPGGTALYSAITDTGYTNCVYYLTGSLNDILIAVSTQWADVKSLSLPPYYLSQEMTVYGCYTTANAAAVCQWQWAS